MSTQDKIESQNSPSNPARRNLMKGAVTAAVAGAGLAAMNLQAAPAEGSVPRIEDH